MSIQDDEPTQNVVFTELQPPETTDDTDTFLRKMAQPNTLLQHEQQGPLLPRMRQAIFSCLFLYFHFLKYTWREIRKRKFSYCLGFLSCLVVVVMSGVALSALSQVPLVFLRLAEVQEGEYDMRLHTSGYVPGRYMNMSKIQESLRVDSSLNGMYSPRLISVNTVYSAKSCDWSSAGKIENSWYVEHMQNVPEQYKDWEWMYMGEFKNATCKSSVVGCVPSYCSSGLDGVYYHWLDTEREAKMGYGRRWDKPKMKKGHGYISRKLAEGIDVQVGDVVLVSLAIASELVGPMRKAGIVKEATTYSDLYPYTITFIPIIVDGILDDYYGKVPAGQEEMILMEYDAMLPHISYFIHPHFNHSERVALSNVNMYDYSEYMYLSHPPERVDVYNENDYDKIQSKIVSFATEVLYNLGYNQVDSAFPVLEYMNRTKFFALFLGLIISIIITILTVLSIILIYSLLMINVENRTFELGVLRMLGINRAGLVSLVLMQAFFYAIPALIVGLIFAQGAYVGISIILQNTIQIQISRFLSGQAILVSSILGTLIPLLSAILPIVAVLGADLRESLDVSRSKTKAVKFHIDRSNESNISWPQLTIGAGMAVFGFGIYYYMPLSLLNLNVTLLVYLFYGILIGMLSGLVVLSLNLEHIIELTVTWVCFFWENFAVRSLVLKNLVAHRVRNRKTSLMFALSLGFIIYIAVSFSLQVITFRYMIIRKYGSRLNLRGGNLQYRRTKRNLENICKSNPLITGYAYITKGLDEVTSLGMPLLTNLGQLKRSPSRVKGISPQFYRTSRSQFLKIAQQDTSNGYTLDEKLYTSDATDKTIISTSYIDLLNLNVNNLFMTQYISPTGRFPKYTYGLMEALAFLSSSPSGTFSMFPNEELLNPLDRSPKDAFVSFPTFMRLANGTFKSMRDIPIDKMLIEVSDKASEADVNTLKAQLKREGVTVQDVEDELRPINIAVQVMDFFFIFTTTIAMIMCFFSLISSMYTNVQEQAKEIGILRAIGTTKFRVTRIFIYEAFVLIITAAISGTCIGVVISYTLTIQRVLFTRLPIDFVFPWQITVTVFVLAILFSIVSALYPTISLQRESIVTIMRRIIS